MAVAHRAQAIAAFLCQGLKLSRAIPASGFPSILATSMAEKSAPAAVLLHPRPPSLVVVRYTAASGPSACAAHSLLTLRYTHRASTRRASYTRSQPYTVHTRAPAHRREKSMRRRATASLHARATVSPHACLQKNRNGGGGGWWLFLQSLVNLDLLLNTDG